MYTYPIYFSLSPPPFSALLSPKFHLFFPSLSLVRSRYRGDISVSGLNGSDLLPARRQRVFAERVYGITEPLSRATTEGEQGKTGPVDATELMAASRRLHGQLNLTPIYAEATKINMAYFELPRRNEPRGFVRNSARIDNCPRVMSLPVYANRMASVVNWRKNRPFP